MAEDRNKGSFFEDLWKEQLKSFTNSVPQQNSKTEIDSKRNGKVSSSTHSEELNHPIQSNSMTSGTETKMNPKTDNSTEVLDHPEKNLEVSVSVKNKSTNSSNTNNRMIRSFTLFDNRDFLPRTFQIELYEACKFRDTIVFLRPGNGKHFITVMLVKYFAPKTGKILANDGVLTSENRKVFFLTKSLNSIRLYGSVLRAHTGFRVAEYYEQFESPDEPLKSKLKWESKQQWLEQFNSYDIHIMRDQLFEHLLTSSYVEVGHVKLLILDDVHQIVLNPENEFDCYTLIVRKMRASDFVRSSQDYRILGLSASILLEDVTSTVFERMIGTIEQQLDCTCETYADLRMINKYSIQCRIRIRYYPEMSFDHFNVLQMSSQFVRKELKFSLFKLRNYTFQYYNFLDGLVDTKMSDRICLITPKILSAAIADVLFAYTKLGEWCAIKLIDLFNREIIDTISLLKSTNSIYVKLLNSTFTTLQLIKKSILAYLSNDLVEKFSNSKDANVEHFTLKEFFSLSSPKLHLLAQLLNDYLAELRSNNSPIQSTFGFPSNICSVIYAEKRSTVRIIALWINELISLTTEVSPTHPFTFLMPDYVFLHEDDRSSGTSSIYFQKHQQKSLHEIFYHRRQEEVLKRFRFAHNCNLLITSSMCAEGLDVNRCNFVCCFDPPETFQQFIQSKGRIRAENGLFYVLVEDHPYDEKNYVDAKFRQFCEIEKIFTKLVPLANEISIESRDDAKKRFKPFNEELIKCQTELSASDSTSNANTTTNSSPQLTMENAISILNRYCLKLPSDTFTKLAPHYYLDSVSIPSDGLAGSNKFQCRLYLPINSTFREEIHGDPMPNRMLAKRSAAFKAVKTLKEIGELDLNYIPIGKETNRYIEKLGLQECFINTTKITNSSAGGVSGSNQRGGNRYNRLQARNIASKRRQYYMKKVADVLTNGQCFTQSKSNDGNISYSIENLYEFEMKLTCPLPEDQNTRGRPLIDPAETTRSFGIIVPNNLPPICDFTIYNRSGEVTVSVKRLDTPTCAISSEQRKRIQIFHEFTFEDVLHLRKSSLQPSFDDGASNGKLIIVPINVDKEMNDQKVIDWNFIDTIIKHQEENKNVSSTTSTDEEVNLDKFQFVPKLYNDAVVIPKYRRDKLQAFFYVAEICKNLTPLSEFPDHGFSTFEEYYRKKYSLTITNLEQPLLDVDHTSTRLNLLTPRYLNRKGVDLTSGMNTSSKKKSSNLQQKQILVPELCIIHPFPASFWRKAVCVPCMLYRLNSLLVAEELRFKISREANIGQSDLPDGIRWPALDFGWSLIVKKVSNELSDNKTSDNSNDKSYNHGGRPIDKNVLQSKRASSKLNGTRDTTKDDPFSSMEDWNSFSNTISNDELPPFPELCDLPHLEIISTGTSEYDFTSFVNEFKVTTKETKEEPNIVEVDDDGNVVHDSQPIRIGSPTQFDEQPYSDDEADEKEEFQDIKISEIDWAAPPEGEEKVPDFSEEEFYKFESMFSVNFEKLSQDISNINNPLYDDQDFLNEISEYYSTDVVDEQDEQNPKKKYNDKVKTVSDDISEDDASYSDFDDFPEEDEDEDPYEEDEIDPDSSDDDSFGDEFDDDVNKPKRKNGSRRCKQENKKRKIKSKCSTSKLADRGNNDSKAFICDELKYELLYDYKQFEPKSENIKSVLFGIEGFDLMKADHANRSRNKRIYERIYRDEKAQILKCVTKISKQFDNEKDSTDFDINKYTPFEEEIDRSLDDIPEDASQSLHEIVFEKFESAHLLNETTNQQDEDEEEPFDIDELKKDPRELMANYGEMGDEVKFGELLPNRNGQDGNAFIKSELAKFSFDRNPNNESNSIGKCLGPDPSLILQAITMSNSSDGINLERLETVGDSFLKYSITAFLFCMCTDLNEGKLSFLRSRQISNINLHRLGQRIQLGQLMIASKFEPNDNWCPPSYKVIEEEFESSSSANRDKVPYNLLTQHSIPNKSIADCVEALIGTYLISSGSQGAIQFMDWLGLKVLPKEFRTLTKIVDTTSEFSANKHDHWLPTPKSPLIIPKDASNETVSAINKKLDEIYRQHRLDLFEETLGYRFRDKAYLVQAFTHNSYYENTVTDCYQRLEFLGDAVLDYLITRYLYEDPRCHSPGTLTDLRSALVNNTFFASLAVKYNFHKYLMMISFELYRVVDGFVRKFNICNQNRLNEQQNQQPADDEYANRSCVYWELFISENEAEHLEDIEVPKALGDIFESVAGAIYLDSGMSLDAVWASYYPMMKPEIEYFSYNVPKSPIRVLLEKQPQSAKFSKPEITSGRKIRVCVEVFNVGKFVGVGRNKRIAKCTAAKRALRALKVIDDEMAKHLLDEDIDMMEQEFSKNFEWSQT